jgi:outer membrane protein assembly factor BamB
LLALAHGNFPAVRRLSIVLVCAALVACPASGAYAEEAVTIHQDPQHTGAVSDPELAPPLHQLWSSQVGGAQASTAAYDWYPIVAGGRIFAPESVDGTHAKLVALDAASGKVLWQTTMAYGIGLAYDKDTLYVTRTDVGLQAVEPSTGAVRWTTVAGGRPVAADGEVVLPADGGVQAFRESDGTRLWQTQSAPDSSGPVAVDGNRVFMSGVGPQISSFDALSGRGLWYHQGSQVGGGNAGLSVRDGRVWGQSGIITWLQNPDGSNHQGPIPGDVVDAGSGALLGHFSGQNAPALTATTAVFHNLYNHTLAAIDARTFQPLWNVDEGAAVMDAVIVNDTVYALTEDGRLLTVSLATGATLDTIKLPGMAADLSAGDGRLAVNGDGWVTTFTGTPTPTAPVGVTASGGDPANATTSGGDPASGATAAAGDPANTTGATSHGTPTATSHTPACTVRRRRRYPTILDASCRITAHVTGHVTARLTRRNKPVARASGKIARGRLRLALHPRRRPVAGTYRLELALHTKTHTSTIVHTVALR